MKILHFVNTVTALAVFLGISSLPLKAEPLKIGYSDWPGWVAWEIAIQKGWFKEAGVDVKFEWYDYVKSMEAYSAGTIDANCVTNGDALVTGATGRPSVCILINDYSNGNDMIVAEPGIAKLKDLKGKKVGIEVGFVEHLLLLKGLEKAGLKAADVTLVNSPTNDLPQMLASKAVSAIGAWQPNSGNALKLVPGSKSVFSSADVPGLIYDGLYVSKESLDKRREDWAKVVGVWYRIVDFIKNEDNMDDALKILAGRVNLKPSEYEVFWKGTKILTHAEALTAFKEGKGLDSIYGSSEVVNAFNVENGVYKEPLKIATYLDPSLTKEYKAAAKEPAKTPAKTPGKKKSS